MYQLCNVTRIELRHKKVRTNCGLFCALLNRFAENSIVLNRLPAIPSKANRIDRTTSRCRRGRFQGCA